MLSQFDSERQRWHLSPPPPLKNFCVKLIMMLMVLCAVEVWGWINFSLSTWGFFSLMERWVEPTSEFHCQLFHLKVFISFHFLPPSSSRVRSLSTMMSLRAFFPAVEGSTNATAAAALQLIRSVESCRFRLPSSEGAMKKMGIRFCSHFSGGEWKINFDVFIISSVKSGNVREMSKEWKELVSALLSWKEKSDNIVCESWQSNESTERFARSFHARTDDKINLADGEWTYVLWGSWIWCNLADMSKCNFEKKRKKLK